MDTTGAVQRTQAQSDALLDAVLAFSADLELSDVLVQIVRSSCSLVGARYGALGVLSPGLDHLVEFVTHGMSREDIGRIGHLPKGLGVLGLVVRNPGPLRLHDVASHPDSCGVPPHHPAMHTFLGVPIRVRGEVFGNLYLTEKEGGADFTEQDEATLVALASAAGVAIDHARLFDRIQHRERWSAAIGELTQTLLEAGAEEDALALMADRARDLACAEAVAVAVYDNADHLVLRSTNPGTSDAVVLDGAHWHELVAAREPRLWLGGRGGAALDGATGAGADGAEAAERAALEVRALAGLEDPGPTALIPVDAGPGDVGVVMVAWRSEDLRHAREVMPALTDFALQAGVAIVAARAQRDRARLALLEERDRIARDMHDNVVQRLFATGLSLQSAAPLAQHPVVRARVLEAVDALDAAIKEIRQAIFELHTVDPASGVLVVLEQLVEDYAQNLGFAPELVVEGRLGSLPERLRSDAIAVVREGLANVARHAEASKVSVTISVGDDLDIAIADNGVGMDPKAARSGLVNLDNRAGAHDGHLTISQSPSGGTVVRWHVPVER